MTTLQTFKVGDGILSRTKILENGVSVDPNEVVLKVRDPDGVETEYATSKVSTGEYEALWFVNKPGTWYRRWRANDASGNSLGASEVPVSVEASVFDEP